MRGTSVKRLNVLELTMIEYHDGINLGIVDAS